MAFTETDYYNRLRHFVTPEGLNTYILQRSYPSISLDEYKKSDPTLPTLTEASLNSFIAVAKGVYYLFYAVVIGLPSDWLTLRTKIFLANWDAAKSSALDAYHHALALKDPLSSAFHTQEKLFLQECQRVDPKELTSIIQLPIPKRPDSKPLPPPPPSTHLPPKSKVSPKDKTTETGGSGTLEARKKALFAKGFSIGAPQRNIPLPSYTPARRTPPKTGTPTPKATPVSEVETSTLTGTALRERMHGLLGAQGLGSMGGTKPPPTSTTRKVPDSVPKAPSASFTPAREKPKVGGLDRKRVADFEKLFKPKN